MRNQLLGLLTVGLFLMGSQIVSAQGCSDAGVCTIDSFKPHTHEDEKQELNQIKVGINLGAADYDISVFGTNIDYNRILGDRFSLDARLTTLAQSGNDISVYGPSDIYLNGNYRAGERTVLTLGFKVPLMDANRKEDGRPLPMDYQSSLGTFDLYAGVGYSIKRFHLLLAFQQPLTQNNNEFLADDYPLTSPLRQFQSTNQYIRRGDVLLRASYVFDFGEKFRFTPSLLPIYHLGNDKFTDSDGIEKEIEGSEGLTFNWNLYFDYNLNDHSALQLNLGAPFVVRDARPDGLTRSFVAGLEYRIRF